MADVRTNLPNLKISVDNTASSDESDNDMEIRDDDDEDSEKQEIPEDEKSDSEEGEVGKDDVEFHVRLGSFTSGHDIKSNWPTGSESVNTEDLITPKASNLSGRSENKERKDDKGAEKGKPEALLQQRVYVNKSGSFVTGIDVTSQEAMEKREKRAARFGVHQHGMEGSEMNISLLYESLDLKEADFEKEELGLRKEALHMRGTDNMSTKDVFDYFTEFPPSAIEWIDDASCNIVWPDKVTATRALLKVSLSYDVAMARLQAETHTETQEGHGVEDKAKQERRDEVDNSTREKPAESSTHLEASGFRKAGRKNEASEEKMEVDDDDELDLVGDGGETGCSTGDRDKRKKNEKADGIDKVRDSQKHREADREEGEDSDSSHSSSGTGSSSRSTSKSGSSSRSDSRSSSGSDSSSDSESETWEFRGSKKKKTSDEQKSQTRDMPRPVEEGSQKKKRQPISWPPGKWRLGIPCKKARHLFLRFATKADKKMPGAEKKSKYYQKYGNPNYGGLKGLISKSRKRKLLYAKTDKEHKKVGGDARDKINQVRTSGRREKMGDGGDGDQREEGEISADDSVVEEEEKKQVVIETPKDLRQLLNRETGGIRLTLRMDHRDPDPVTSQKRPEVGKKVWTDGDDEDEMDFEAELKHLLEEPPKKRVMRMHADDEEEKIRARRAKSGILTITAASLQGGVRSRLGERVQQHDIRTFEDEEEGEALSDYDDVDDFNSADYRANQSSGKTDLRSKLSARKQKTYSEAKRESMRIEVFD